MIRHTRYSKVTGVQTCALPISINGAAVTGGFELALACDLLIASETARFADTHARVGVLPGWGLSQRLPRLIGVNRAKELSLTGNFLSARQAESWGLVNRVVEPDRLLAVASALAADMLSASPEILVAMKRLIDDGAATTLNRGLEIERERSRAWAKRSIRPPLKPDGEASSLARARGALDRIAQACSRLSSALSAGASLEARR
jgi:enoyl-CoA hydratase